MGNPSSFNSGIGICHKPVTPDSVTSYFISDLNSVTQPGFDLIKTKLDTKQSTLQIWNGNTFYNFRTLD